MLRAYSSRNSTSSSGRLTLIFIPVMLPSGTSGPAVPVNVTGARPERVTVKVTVPVSLILPSTMP